MVVVLVLVAAQTYGAIGINECNLKGNFLCQKRKKKKANQKKGRSHRETKIVVGDSWRGLCVLSPDEFWDPIYAKVDFWADLFSTTNPLTPLTTSPNKSGSRPEGSNGVGSWLRRQGGARIYRVMGYGNLFHFRPSAYEATSVCN